MNNDTMNMGAVIMVGGSGKRMGALTRNTPKPLLKIGNHAILDYILGSLEYLGVHRKNMIVVVKYLAEQIHSHLSNMGYTVITGRQKSIALNLIDVLPLLPGNFIAMSSDLYSLDLLEEASDTHLQSEACATLIIAKLADDAPRRKYWHYTMAEGFLKNLEKADKVTDWERDLLIFERRAVEKISDNIQKILHDPSSANEKYKKFSNSWNLVLKLLLDNGLKIKILEKEFCRCYRINFPEDLQSAVSIVKKTKLKCLLDRRQQP